MPAADVLRLLASLGRFEHLDDLLFGEAALPHRVLRLTASLAEDSHKDWPSFRGAGHTDEAVVTMREDTDLPTKVRQDIPYTDFPFEDFSWYCIDNIMLLKNEY
jgi:hypothetical protein